MLALCRRFTANLATASLEELLSRCIAEHRSVICLLGTIRERSAMAYQPIENYGIIVDMHSVAFVGMDGSIDWLCFPHFDSLSTFAAILGQKKGGRFKISPAFDGCTSKQLYWPDTNVLITRVFSPDGVGEITDYMPTGVLENGHGHHQLIRRVKVVRDTMMVSNSLVYRYDVEKLADGVTGEESTFSLCTFWLVEARTRARWVNEACLIFEQMLSNANHLRLY